MTSYKKVGNHWEVIPASKETETVDETEANNAINTIENKLKIDKIKEFVKQDSPADFILKLFIPRYYNDGSKVSPDAIADILQKISEAIGGASTWVGKGYWTEDNILYEDKNIYIETLLKQMSPERASLLAKYISSVIAGTLKQNGALFVLIPALAEFISENEYITNEKETLENIKNLNEQSENYQPEE